LALLRAAVLPCLSEIDDLQLRLLHHVLHRGTFRI
jgi:hypothetical protein